MTAKQASGICLCKARHITLHKGLGFNWFAPLRFDSVGLFNPLTKRKDMKLFIGRQDTLSLLPGISIHWDRNYKTGGFYAFYVSFDWIFWFIGVDIIDWEDEEIKNKLKEKQDD